MTRTSPATEPFALTVTEASAALRDGRLSPVELTESLLRRIEATEPSIHAYVVVTGDEALAAARRAEDALQRGEADGPLHGIPLAIKDIFDVAGVPTRCGSRARADAPPAAEDSRPVALLRSAGAIVLGKTVTQEFAAGVVSVPARNPWDPTRIPGGSSGGSGAAVAAGSAIAAMGSDTGGSIRIPASVNGTVGLKPTYGLASKRGVFPLSWSLDTVGPLTRTVADAALILNVIAGPDPDDLNSARRPAGDATAELGQDLRGLRIGVARGFFFERVQPGVTAAVEAAVETFAQLGATVIDTPWDDAGLARATGFMINRGETLAVHSEGLRRAPELYGDELRRRLEASVFLPGEAYLRAQQARGRVRASIARLFADQRLDALIAPALPAPALPADDLVARYPDGSAEPVSLAYTRFSMPFNATGQPVLAVPCGLDEQGLPVGLQIAGRPFAEARLCRIGQALEAAIDWPARLPVDPGKAQRND